MWRDDFPLLKGEDIAYLDSAASTQKPCSVIEAVGDFYRTRYSNVHRGVYPLSEEATLLYEKARERAAKFINASPDEIIFVKNATEAINLAANSFFEAFVRPGDTVLTTVAEHHSNFVPWQQLAKRRGVHFRVVPVDIMGRIELSRAVEELGKRPKLLSIAHVSNVLGTVNPVKEIIALAHRNGATVIVDGAQAVPHVPVDVKDMDADFYAFSGHKVYGPDGIGVLYGKRRLLESLPPFLYGGDMIQEVHLSGTVFNEIPYKFEAGTPPIAGAVGLAKALDYVEGIGFENIGRQEDVLLEEAFDILSSMRGVEIYGPSPRERKGVIAFNVDGVHPHDVAGFLGTKGVCVRAGHHCAQPLHDFLGIHASVRMSLGVYNTRRDLVRLARGLEEVRRIFSKAA